MLFTWFNYNFYVHFTFNIYHNHHRWIQEAWIALEFDLPWTSFEMCYATCHTLHQCFANPGASAKTNLRMLFIPPTKPLLTIRICQKGGFCCVTMSSPSCSCLRTNLSACRSSWAVPRCTWHTAWRGPCLSGQSAGGAACGPSGWVVGWWSGADSEWGCRGQWGRARRGMPRPCSSPRRKSQTAPPGVKHRHLGTTAISKPVNHWWIFTLPSSGSKSRWRFVSCHMKLLSMPFCKTSIHPEPVLTTHTDHSHWPLTLTTHTDKLPTFTTGASSFCLPCPPTLNTCLVHRH